MHPPTSFHRRHPVVTWLIGAVLAVLALLVFMLTLFDWNWVKPAVENYLTKSSQRRVHFDDLQIRFSRNLAPTVRLRGVEIENAPWADKRPFAKVGEVTFVFSTLRTIFDDRSVVSHLILVDGDVDMERQANGLRNWRLRQPDYTGPGKYKVLRLEARNSRVRFVNREIGLDLTATSQAAPAGREAGSGPALPNRIRFTGDYGGTPFTGDLFTAYEMSLQETGEYFPLRGHGSADGARMELDGRIADFFKMGGLDAQARISGTSLAGVAPFVRTRLPATPAYRATGHVKITQESFALEGFRGKLGETDLSGSASVNRNEERRLWQAQLRSELARWQDLRTLLSWGSPAAGEAAGPTAARREGRGDKVLSNQAWHLDRLRAEDARISLEVARFAMADVPALQSLRLRADLQGGMLKLDPVDLGVAGGHARGTINLDARQPQVAASLNLEARALDLDQLTRPYPAAAAGGALSARARLEGRGESLSALLGGASGTLNASVEQGRISEMLDAKLGLNGGKMLWVKLRGDREIALSCAALNLDFRNGIGRSRSLVLDSEKTRVAGQAMVDLRQERFDVVLMPRAKQGRVFGLGDAIHASGTFRQAGYEIAKGEAAGGNAQASEARCPAVPGPAGAGDAQARAGDRTAKAQAPLAARGSEGRKLAAAPAK